MGAPLCIKCPCNDLLMTFQTSCMSLVMVQTNFSTLRARRQFKSHDKNKKKTAAVNTLNHKWHLKFYLKTWCRSTCLQGKKCRNIFCGRLLNNKFCVLLTHSVKCQFRLLKTFVYCKKIQTFLNLWKLNITTDENLEWTFPSCLRFRKVFFKFSNFRNQYIFDI